MKPISFASQCKINLTDKKWHLFALANNSNNIHYNKTINIDARHEFKTSLPASGFIFATVHIQLDKKNSIVTHAKTMNFQSPKAIMRFLTLIALRFCNLKYVYVLRFVCVFCTYVIELFFLDSRNCVFQFNLLKVMFVTRFPIHSPPLGVFLLVLFSFKWFSKCHSEIFEQNKLKNREPISKLWSVRLLFLCLNIQ